MYRPLPEGLKIQNSGINGQGLFTMVFLKRDTDLGMSHFVINDNYKDKPKSEISDDDQIRTPLGGFLNHSNDPNCIIIKKGNRYYINTIKDITGGDELTLNYGKWYGGQPWPPKDE